MDMITKLFAEQLFLPMSITLRCNFPTHLFIYLCTGKNKTYKGTRQAAYSADLCYWWSLYCGTMVLLCSWTHQV